MKNFSPILFCFIGPGASGKSSICTALIESNLPVHLSISSTSRLPRGNEVDGNEYYFKTREQFQQDIEDKLFLEYAEFTGDLYGTGLINYENSKKLRKHLLLDIEINGVKSLKKALGSSVVVTFVCPPKLSDLRERFELRASDLPERIDERMELAKLEIQTGLHSNISDYVIINRDIEESVAQAKAIVLAEQVRRERVNFIPEELQKL